MPKIHKQRSATHAMRSSSLVTGNGKPSGAAPLNVLARISSIAFDESDGIQIMIYGKSGTGKTTLWSSFPDPILAIICSGSERSGELRSVDTEENRERIQQVRLNESSELNEVVQHCAQTGQYKTIVLDHISGLQDLILKEVLGLQEIPQTKHWGLATQQDWGQVSRQCIEYLRRFLNLAGNTVIIAQEKEDKGKEGSEFINPSIGPNVIPSLAAWVNPTVDYIVQTFKKQHTVIKKVKIGKGPKAVIKDMEVEVKGKVDFCIRTGIDALYTTKFRVPKGRVLPDLIDDPDYTKILTALRGDWSGER